MGVFDQIAVSVPGWRRSGEQTYVEIADSYGDWYQITPDGRLWRLTCGAGMSTDPRHRLPAPLWLRDYTGRSAITWMRGPYDTLDVIVRRGWLVRLRVSRAGRRTPWGRPHGVRVWPRGRRLRLMFHFRSTPVPTP